MIMRYERRLRLAALDQRLLEDIKEIDSRYKPQKIVATKDLTKLELVRGEQAT